MQNHLDELINHLDNIIIPQLRKYGLKFLRYSIAVVFIWFGALKVVGYSPASELAAKTVYWLDPGFFVPFLGCWEVLIGVCFLFRPFLRFGILILAPQMAGTFLPLVLLPQVVYQNGNILLPTLEGQYIIKNLVIISASMVIGAHVKDAEEKA
ncbi:MAG: hypothetical protein AABX51_08745 [Nanoarchaeota archaeon]